MKSDFFEKLGVRPEMINLLKISKANIYWSQDFPQAKLYSRWINIANGLYIFEHDCILINEILLNGPIEKLENVLLHELIHWSGIGARLNRPTIKNIVDGKSTEKNLFIEELVANKGAYLLAKIMKSVFLQFHRDIYESLLYQCKEHLTRFDLQEIDMLALQSTNYLLTLTKSKNAA